MKPISSIQQLETLYGAVNPRSLTKVATEMTPLYRKWIERSRFAILSTVGANGTDASPRGDDGPVVKIADQRTLMMPDWRGNNRLDCLRNIVLDPRVSLMFMITGCSNVVRVNGSAIVTSDSKICEEFVQNGKHPRTVIVVTLDEMYFQCAKAIMRSGLWTSGDQSDGLPTAGQFLKEVEAKFDAEDYDDSYAERARTIMW